MFRTGITVDANNVGYRSIPVSGDFEIFGAFHIYFNDNFFAIGYQKTAMPLSGNSNNANNFASYFNGDTVTGLVDTANGVGGTSTPVGNYSFATGQPAINWYVKRVGSAISAYFNGTLIFTDSYSGDLYFGISITSNTAFGNEDYVTAFGQLARNCLSPVNFIYTESALATGGTAAPTVTGFRLNGTGGAAAFLFFQVDSSDYQNLSVGSNSYQLILDYEVTIAPSTLSNDFVINFGNYSLSIPFSDPKMTVGLHTEVFYFSCNPAGVGFIGLTGKFALGLNNQSGQQVFIKSYLIEQV